MSEDEFATPPRRAVRVELLDAGRPASPQVDAPLADHGQNRWPVALMGVALVTLVGGLWWAAGLSEAERAGERDDPPIDREQFDGDAVAGGGLQDVDDEGGSADERLESRELFVTLPADLQHVINGPRGLLASGTFYNDVSAEFSQVPALTRTADGRVWTSGTMQSISAGERIVGLVEEPDDTGEGVIAFTVDAPSDGDDTSVLRLYGSRGGSDNVWTERNSFVIEGFIRTVAARDGRWVASVEERLPLAQGVAPTLTRLTTGTIDGDAVDDFRVGSDEVITSIAPFADGVLAVVDRLASPAVEGDAPPLELRRWRPVEGWEVVTDDLSTAAGAPSRLIDAGARGAFLSSGPRLLRADLNDPIESVLASAEEIFDRLPEGFVPELTPALLDAGYLVVDDVGGATSQLWVSVDGLVWRRHDLEEPMTDVVLLSISNGAALLSGTRDGVEGVLRLDVLGPLPLDVRPEAFREGEWTNPVYAEANPSDRGFVSLTSTMGRADLIESSNGFDATTATATDLPFGYLATEMTTTSRGYHVVGQLGLIEDAVFTSPDGVGWQRFEIERPNDASTLRIEHFSRGVMTEAMAGVLGWADDPGRVENVAFWWDGAGRQVQIPERPCANDAWVCTITSLVAVDDGVLATHERDRSTAVSKWTEADGWQSIAALDPEPLDAAVFASTSSSTAWLLNSERAVRSDDGGNTWIEAIERPPGETGRFIGVSPSGAAAVFETSDALWFRRGQEWTAYALGNANVREVTAITDSAALMLGTAEAGLVLIRLAPPPTG